MSFVDHLYQTRTPLELAKLAVQVAKENATLRDQVDALKHELFWMKIQIEKEPTQ